MANKVPYETCEFVPSVKCHLVLKKVAELECVPVVEEECNDFAKEVPYLVGEEECEEVVYDDCFEVSAYILFLGVEHRCFSFRSRSKFLSFFAKGRGSMTNPSFFREDRFPLPDGFQNHNFPSSAGVQKRRRKKAEKDRCSIQGNKKRLTQFLSQGGGEGNSNNKQKKIQTLFARDVEMESSRSSQRLFMCSYLPEI